MLEQQVESFKNEKISLEATIKQEKALVQAYIKKE